jgi:uroporphyrinogen-III synthase
MVVMGGRVLVTRPEPGASRTARRLAEAGFEPVVLPLTEIRPLAVGPLSRSSAIDAVAVTSANAIRNTPRQLIETLAGKPLFAVGNRTAGLAREAGFSQVFEGEGGAVGLAGQMTAQLGPNAQVLYLCGRVRRPEFEAVLAGGGLAVDALETYDTVEMEQPADSVVSVCRNEPVDAALVLSARTAEAASSIVRLAGVAHLFANTRYFCISERVAAALTGIDRSHIYVAETPDEDALMTLLERES